MIKPPPPSWGGEGQPSWPCAHENNLQLSEQTVNLKGRDEKGA